MRKVAIRELKVLSVILVLVVFAGIAGAGVKLVTKNATFYPEKKFGRICRVKFDSTRAGACFLVVKNAAGRVVRTIPVKCAKGENKVDWDGKDTTGKLVPVGEYTASICDGMNWELDKAFGAEGRIGLVEKTIKVEDPENCALKVAGTPAKVAVNGKEFTKVNSFEVAGPYYTLKDGTLTISPVAGVKKGDVVSVSEYFPCYLQNPWDVEIDADGEVFVLINYKEEAMRYRQGKLLKLRTDGKALDADFAMDGVISVGTRCGQFDISAKLRRIFIAERDKHRIGVYSLLTGAPLFKIGGGHGDKSASNTTYPTGVTLDAGGTELFVNTGALKDFDPGKEGKSGILRCDVKDHSYAPLRDNYWGPSLAKGSVPGEVYRSDYGSRIMKFKDTGKELVKLYSIRVPGAPVGMAFDKDHGILFAALRTVAGKLALIKDDGMRMEILDELKDMELGTLHDVAYHNGSLYVLEDGIAPKEAPLRGMRKSGVDPKGRSRISKYKLILAPGKETVKITRK